MEPVLFDQTDPRARGEAHGELWRAEIQELVRIRTALTMVRGSFESEGQVMALADRHVPFLEREQPDLAAELLGIARAAEVTPAQIVVLNHYTDLRDIAPSVLDEPDPGGCTTLYLCGSDGPILGQTWDMHGTAEPFVRMIRIQPEGQDTEVLSFTLTGCLGMTGINADGVAVSINNLTCTDAQVGMIWPALVRSMLTERTAVAARDRLMRTRLSSGHHYMIADPSDFYGVETTGKLKVTTQKGPKTAHFHTNHCFDPKLRQHERVAPTSTTFRRIELASTMYVQQRPETAREMYGFLSSHEGHPRSLCSHVDDETGDPSASKTCGLMVMSLIGGGVLAKRGCGQVGEPTEMKVERWRGPTTYERPTVDPTGEGSS
jgi:isopenicillin-N N-acyltransferase-like protein